MATIIDLLMALNRGELPALPAPANPMSLGPLQPEGPTDFSFSPEAPPTAPPDELDRDLIARYAGAAPTPPAPRSTLDRVANALLGFSAGVQGQGGQFLQQLQQPQRDFEAATERFNARTLRGVEAAEDKQLRSQERRQRAAERRFDIEVEQRAREMGFKNQIEIEKLRDAMLTKRQREDDERQAAREQKRAEEQQERDARQISARLGTGPGAAPPRIADELGRFYAKLTDTLSPAAEKWRNAQARRADILANRAGGTGSGAGGGNAASLERQFNSLKAQFLRAEKRTTGAPHGDRGLQSRTAAQILAVMDKLAKLGYEVGFDPSGVYPYIKPPGGQQQPAQAAPQGQQNDPGGVRQFLRQ